MCRSISSLLLALLAVFLVGQGETLAAGPGNNSGSKITKCKDTEGNWHYGDFATDVCAADSNVTELNEQGVRVHVEESLKSRREKNILSDVSRRKSEKQKSEQEARNKDLRLLSMYESVEQIILARDERLEFLSGFMLVDQEFLGRLQDQQISLEERYAYQASEQVAEEIKNTEAYIERYERVIANRIREREEIVRQYNKDIERYRRLSKLKNTEEHAQADN